MKSKYETHVLPYLDKIEAWAQKGATQKEIAKKLGVSERAFRDYLSKAEEGDERYLPLLQAFARACEEPDDTVESALFKSAVGYNAKIVKHYKVKTVEYDPETGRRIREVEELKEAYDEVHVPANVSAQQFWLTNRRADKWKYKPEPTESDGDEGGGAIVLAPVMEASKPPEANDE